VQSLEWKVESARKLCHFPLSTLHYQLLVFFMQLMATAATAKLFKLKPVRRVLFVLCRYVVALFALGALQNNIISWHKSSFGVPPLGGLPIHPWRRAA
jgi:hypothetical protein